VAAVGAQQHAALGGVGADDLAELVGEPAGPGKAGRPPARAGPAERGQEGRVGQPGPEPHVRQGQQPLHGGGVAAHGRGDRRPGHGHGRLDGHVPPQGGFGGLLQGAGPDPTDVGPADIVPRHRERRRPASRRGPRLPRQGGGGHEDDLREPVGPLAVAAEGGRLLDRVGQGTGPAVGHVGPADGERRGQPAPVERVQPQPGLVDQEAHPDQHGQQDHAQPGRPAVGGRGRPGGHEHEHEGQHRVHRPDDQALPEPGGDLPLDHLALVPAAQQAAQPQLGPAGPQLLGPPPCRAGQGAEPGEQGGDDGGEGGGRHRALDLGRPGEPGHRPDDRRHGDGVDGDHRGDADGGPEQVAGHPGQAEPVVAGQQPHHHHHPGGGGEGGPDTQRPPDRGRGRRVRGRLRPAGRVEPGQEPGDVDHRRRPVEGVEADPDHHHPEGQPAERRGDPAQYHPERRQPLATTVGQVLAVAAQVVLLGRSGREHVPRRGQRLGLRVGPVRASWKAPVMYPPPDTDTR
jgi:hypothetical protein